MLAGIDAIGGFVSPSSSGGGTSGSFWLDISPAELSKTGGTTGPSKTLTTSNVTVTPHGGAPGYTYSWARTSGSALITCATPTSSITNFSATLSADQAVDAVFTCTVTDSASAVLTIPVSVHIELVNTT